MNDIYTVGKFAMYEESFMDCEQKVYKGKGSPVWKTYERAEQYLRRTAKCDDFGIYAVNANWFSHTVNYGYGWNDLIIDAKMHRIQKCPSCDFLANMFFQFSFADRIDRRYCRCGSCQSKWWQVGIRKMVISPGVKSGHLKIWTLEEVN